MKVDQAVIRSADTASHGWRIAIVPWEWSCVVPVRDPEHRWDTDAVDTEIFGVPVRFGLDRHGEWCVFRFPSGWTVNFIESHGEAACVYGHWDHDRVLENWGRGPFICGWDKLLAIVRDLSEREPWGMTA